MMHDYTAPEMRVIASRTERFQQVFELYQADGVTPDTSRSGWAFFGDVFDRAGQRVLLLSNGNGTSRPAPHAVLVELSTIQMNQFRPGSYRLEVYSTLGGERENLVNLLLQIE